MRAGKNYSIVSWGTSFYTHPSSRGPISTQSVSRPYLIRPRFSAA